MKKVSAQWVPRLLTVKNKRRGLSMSKQCLHLFKRNRQDFLHRLVTIDQRQTPNDSQNNGFFRMNLLRRKQKRSHRPERQWPRFYGTRMATILWDSKGIILVDFCGKEEQSRGSTTLNYWIDSIRNWGRHGPTITGLHNHRALSRPKYVFFINTGTCRSTLV